MFLFLLACTPAQVESAASVTVADVEQVVPGAALPADVLVQPSANNLDVIEFDGQLFFAFRTAPTHFASTETVIYLLRSPDQGSTWNTEASFAMGTDLREPRFASVNGALFFYFAVLGENAADFEPQGTRYSARAADGSWSSPEWLFEDSFIPWRVHSVEGGAQLVGYTGGGEIYDFEAGDGDTAGSDTAGSDTAGSDTAGSDTADTDTALDTADTDTALDTAGSDTASDSADTDPWPDIQIKWLASTNGVDWTAAVGDNPVVQEGGGSETDWAILDDGALVAVTRNEAGDEMGFGSKICRAEANSLGDWLCAADPKKYDSPWVFREGSSVYLVGRRNVTETGNFDLGRTDLEFQAQALTYAAAYWGEAKRCALWRVDPVELSVRWVLDLPSRGDTCFASGYRESEGRWVVYNYSSPIDGPDPSWLEGQLGETRIYRQTLVFSEQ